MICHSSANTLIISFVGMQTQEVEIQPNVEVSLKTDMEMLDEVVVVGYGTGKKLGSVVGSVSTVGTQKLEAKPNMNFGDALQGQVAGLQVMTSSGEPTETSSMRIRGVSTLNAGTEPLYILDGAPVSSNVFTSLNPNDIEHITVLKDAASTSIYGARAANGVIFITTKRGKGGETAEVTVRGTYGISQLPNMDKDMMNARQYMDFRAIYNPNIVNDPTYQQQLARLNKYGLSMDWQDYVMNNNAPTYTVDASISGSSEKTNYYISAGHFDQEGTSFQSYLKRHNVRMNLNSKVNDWLRVGMNAYMSYQDYSTTLGSSTSDGAFAIYSPLVMARMGSPMDFPYEIIENGDGTWSRGEETFTTSFGLSNPVLIFRNSRARYEQTRGNMMTFEELTPVKGLTLRAQQAYEGFIVKYRSEDDPWLDYNQNNGSLGEQFQRGSQWTFTNTIEYKHSFNKVHNLTLLAGQESILYGTDLFNVSGKGITDIRLYQISNLTPSSLSANGKREEYVFNSYFFRGEYNYDEKYYVEGSYRRDGSSRFSPDNRLIMSCGRDRTIKLWNTLGECQFTLDKESHNDWVTCVRFVPNMEEKPRIVSCGYDKLVKVWNLETMKVEYNLIGHSQVVNKVVVSPDGVLCASAGKDGCVIVWDLANGVENFRLTLEDPVTDLVFSPANYWIAVATTNEIVLFDLETKERVASVKPEFPPRSAKALVPYCTSLCWSLDGATLFAGYTDNVIRVWEVKAM